MLPADELHRVRAEIRVLKAREAALVSAMVGDPGGPACRGRAWQARVEARVRPVLDPARLPLGLIAHPAAWTLRRSLRVRLAPAGRRPGAAPLVAFGLVPAD